MIERYTNPEMGKLWSLRHEFEEILAVEIAACEAMAELGESPKEACEGALRELSARKIELGEDAGSISLIALSPDGRFGAATTLPCFPFAAAFGDETALYAADAGGTVRPVRPEELDGVD